MEPADHEVIYEEKQYLGHNKYSFFRRMIFAIFCFLAYYFSENEKISGKVKDSLAVIDDTGRIFFFMGMVILIISALLIFLLHIKTQVFRDHIILDGLWTARRVKIDLRGVKSAEVVRYSKYLLNRPVYNLHRRGKIRFFTSGNDAVQLTDKDGLIYLVGSQNATMLKDCINNQLSDLNKAGN